MALRKMFMSSTNCRQIAGGRDFEKNETETVTEKYYRAKSLENFPVFTKCRYVVFKTS